MVKPVRFSIVMYTNCVFLTKVNKTSILTYKSSPTRSAFIIFETIYDLIVFTNCRMIIFKICLMRFLFSISFINNGGGL